MFEIFQWIYIIGFTLFMTIDIIGCAQPNVNIKIFVNPTFTAFIHVLLAFLFWWLLVPLMFIMVSKNKV